MKIVMRSVVLLAALVSASAMAQSFDDPSLHLRESFIAGYAAQAAQRGYDGAAAEGGCVFDHLSTYLTVAQWIAGAKRMQDGEPPQFHLTQEQAAAIQSCVKPKG